MFLVVGLGNPGKQYEGTRHNVGFEVVDALREEAGWPDYGARFSGLLTRGSMGDVAVALLKPQTFMNASGDSVQPAAGFFRVPPPRIVVVHDEVDLPWREVRLKKGGGHAGHNGLRSIIARLGADFVRVRVGVGRPAVRAESSGARPLGAASTGMSAWVLSRFDANERAEMPEVRAAALAAVRSVVAAG